MPPHEARSHDGEAESEDGDAGEDVGLLNQLEGCPHTLPNAPGRVLERSRLSAPKEKERPKPRKCGAGQASSPLPWLRVCALAGLLLAQEGKMQVVIPFREFDQPATLATRICTQYQELAVTIVAQYRDGPALDHLTDEECAQSLLPYLQEKARERTRLNPWAASLRAEFIRGWQIAMPGRFTGEDDCPRQPEASASTQVVEPIGARVVEPRDGSILTLPQDQESTDVLVLVEFESSGPCVLELLFDGAHVLHLDANVTCAVAVVHDVKVGPHHVTVAGPANQTVVASSVSVASQEPPGTPGLVVAAHFGHDSTMAVVQNGRVVGVLEMERLFAVRHYMWPGGHSALKSAEHLHQAVSVLFGMAPNDVRPDDVFAVGVLSSCTLRTVDGKVPAVFELAVEDGRATACSFAHAMLSQRLSAQEWHYAEHHRAHASLGFYDSPYASAVVLSYDGGGNDGHLRVFTADRTHGISAVDGAYIEQLRQNNMGLAYGWLGMIIPQIHSDAVHAPSRGHRKNLGVTTLHENVDALHALPGKLMALAARGEVRPSWLVGLRQHFLNFTLMYNTEDRPFPHSLLRSLRETLTDDSLLTEREALDLAASGQAAFEAAVLELMTAIGNHVSFGEFEGLIITGSTSVTSLTSLTSSTSFTSRGLRL